MVADRFGCLCLMSHSFSQDPKLMIQLYASVEVFKTRQLVAMLLILSIGSSCYHMWTRYLTFSTWGCFISGKSMPPFLVTSVSNLHLQSHHNCLGTVAVQADRSWLEGPSISSAKCKNTTLRCSNHAPFSKIKTSLCRHTEVQLAAETSLVFWCQRCKHSFGYVKTRACKNDPYIP